MVVHGLHVRRPMANLESTAINDLIHRVGNKPLTRESAVEVTFQPTAPQVAPSTLTARSMPPRTLPVTGQRRPSYRQSLSDSAEVTLRVPRTLRRSYATIGMFAAGSFMLGIAGFYIVRGDRHPATATVVEVMPEPIPEPVAAPTPVAVAAAAPLPVAAAPAAPAPEPVLPTSAVLATPEVVVPVLVDLRLDSNPTGASVILIDRGKSAPLGTTPLQASVDPTREYDLVFSVPGRPPKIEHVDPRARVEVSVSIAAPATPAPVQRPHAKPHSKRPTARHARR